MSQGMLSSITLGVKDLDVGTRFYSQGLGFSAREFEGVDHELGRARFFMLGAVRLGLWPLGSMRADTGVDFACAQAPAVYGLTLLGAAEVDEVFERAIRHGGSAIAAPRPNFWGGYSAYVADPDEHVWEVVFDPGVLEV